jgi:DNA-binding NarL/FixJ family response regulator
VPLNVLIVDDSVSVRRALRLWIEGTGDMIICGEAENGAVAVTKVKELRPDVVILDFQMPVMDGLEAARAIAIIAPQIHLLMLTLHTHPELARQAKAAGIAEVLSKEDAVPHQLLASLKRMSDSSASSVSES